MTALENMAAAARPPGIGDARVPCPLCGGLIHPVAGRCKHCKEDLSAFRAGRPQAAVALPALNGTATNGTNGHPVASVAAPVAVAHVEPSQPILPQRPTGRSVPAQRPRALWRSWPMIVIVLAGVAIVIAVVMMVMPLGNASGGRKLMSPPASPAPERMETNPLPPSQHSGIDPWAQPPGTQPRQPDPVPPGPMPPDDPDDLYGGLSGGGGGGGVLGGGTLGGGMGGSAVMLAMFDRACAKMKSCPSIDQSMVSTVCDQLSSMPKLPAPTSCAKAQSCLAAIDGLSCTQAGSNNPLAAVYLIKDCVDALNEC